MAYSLPISPTAATSRGFRAKVDGAASTQPALEAEASRTSLFRRQSGSLEGPAPA